jgi:hypothetical protein
LDVAAGGTGGSTPGTARSGLGLGTLSQQDANDVDISGGEITGIVDLAVTDGGTGASTAAQARTNLGIGTVATQNSNNVNITGGSITGITPLPVPAGGTGASNQTDARINLGMGDIAVQNANAVAISGGLIQGVVIQNLNEPLAITEGGTGGTNVVAARTNLGIDTMALQPSTNVNITGGNISGVNPIPVASGGTGANTAVQARTNLGLGSIAIQNSSNVSIDGGFINALSAPLAIVDGGTGATTASAARTNLGLGTGASTNVGTIAVQNSNNVNITGGSITGIVDLAVGDGGTGASTAAGARLNLGVPSTTIQISAGAGLTGGGDLSTNLTLSIATNSNGFGTRYVSTGSPTGGVNGDIWYQI